MSIMQLAWKAPPGMTCHAGCSHDAATLDPAHHLLPGVLRILSALEIRDMTAAQLAVAARLAVNTLRTGEYLPRLRELRLIHIAGWLRLPNHIVPVYRRGGGDDAPRPNAYSHTERMTRYVQRNRAKVNFYRRYTRAKESQRPMFKMVVDPLLVAMGVFVDNSHQTGR